MGFNERLEYALMRAERGRRERRDAYIAAGYRKIDRLFFFSVIGFGICAIVQLVAVYFRFH